MLKMIDGGYEGEKELMNQFGLENRNELTLVVHKDRFQDLTKQDKIRKWHRYNRWFYIIRIRNN